ATRVIASVVPDVVGTPAKTPRFVLSSWQVASQPSPAEVPPSSHSSLGASATPFPHTGGGGTPQSGGAGASFRRTKPVAFLRLWPPKRAQYVSVPRVRNISTAPAAGPSIVPSSLAVTLMTR